MLWVWLLAHGAEVSPWTNDIVYFLIFQRKLFFVSYFLPLYIRTIGEKSHSLVPSHRSLYKNVPFRCNGWSTTWKESVGCCWLLYGNRYCYLGFKLCTQVDLFCYCAGLPSSLQSANPAVERDIFQGLPSFHSVEIVSNWCPLRAACFGSLIWIPVPAGFQPPLLGRK